MKRYLKLVVGLLVIIVIGCAVPAGPGAQPGETPAEPTQTPGLQLPGGAVELIQRVRDELATQLGQAADRIDVVDVQSDEWPTAAMGCPDPNKTYAQVVTSGYAVRLKAGDTTYEVHVSQAGNVVVCEGDLLAVPEQARDLVRQARTGLAEHLNQAEAALAVVDVQAMEWPTAAMGCPQPDQSYAQVVTPGYAVRLKTDDTVYEVHVSESGKVVFCETGKESQNMQVPAAAEPAATAAQEDLAARIGVNVADIEITDFESVEWSNSSLGCPEPGKMYAQVITPGYRIVLQAAGETYEYHTDRNGRVVLCEGGPAAAASEKERLAGVREAVEQARGALAERLGVEPAAVTVEQAAWVGQLDQPEPCPAADELTGAGRQYQITLRTGGTTYVYRAQGQTAVSCSD